MRHYHLDRHSSPLCSLPGSFLGPYHADQHDGWVLLPSRTEHDAGSDQNLGFRGGDSSKSPVSPQNNTVDSSNEGTARRLTEGVNLRAPAGREGQRDRLD